MGGSGTDLIPSSHGAQLLEWVGWFTTLEDVVGAQRVGMEFPTLIEEK